MSRRLALSTMLVTTLVATVASAQEVTIGYQGLPYKMPGESNTGIQVSDGVLLHVGAGAEAGYDTNVFYQSSAPISSPIYRTSLFGELANATRSGGVGLLSFDARAGVTYRYYGSSEPNVEAFKNAWMPTAGLSVSTGTGRFGFGLADTFARIEDPPYSPSASVPIIRDNNQASAEVRWSPGGGRITGTFRYTNMVDIFENNGPLSYAYATTDSNYLMIDGSWKWLPKTAIFLNVNQGYVFYLNQTQANNNGKSSLFPLTVSTGFRGLLTEKTSATIGVGYSNGFYSNGVTTGGVWGSTYIDASVAAHPTFLSRAVLGFRHDFTNAVVASYSLNETAYASWVQQIAGRLAVDLSGRYQYRAYGGNFVEQMQGGRADNVFQLGVTLDYFVRNWVYAGLGYALAADSVNKPNLDYIKQQMFVRLGLTY